MGVFTKISDNRENVLPGYIQRYVKKFLNHKKNTLNYKLYASLVRVVERKV